MPIPLIVIGGILLLLLLLLALRVRVIILYEDEVVLRLKLLCFGLTLYPRKPKLKKRAKKKTKKQKKKPDKGHRYGEKKKRSLGDKLRLVRALTAVLIKKTHKHLRLHAAKLHIRVATGDAAKTAILYGAVSGTLSYILALLDKVTKLKASVPDVDVFPDFLGERPSAEVKIVFSLRVWGAFAILFGAVLAYFKVKINKKRFNDKTKKHAAKAAVR